MILEDLPLAPALAAPRPPRPAAPRPPGGAPNRRFPGCTVQQGRRAERLADALELRIEPCAKKLGKGGRSPQSETFQRNSAGANPVRQRWDQPPEASLAW